MVQEDDAALVDLRFDLPSMFPDMAAKLKDISEVRREVEHELEDLRAGAKAANAQPLISRAGPEKL